MQAQTPTDPARACGYRPLADYALIGNTFSAALVAPDGSIDWCCLPHFDSPAVFCRLLDARRGGSLRAAPVQPGSIRRRYLPRSAVLETEFRCESGVLRLVDCMPCPVLVEAVPASTSPGRPRLLRRLEALEGRVDVAVDFAPTFDYARGEAALTAGPAGCLAATPRAGLHLASVPALDWVVQGSRAQARKVLEPGEVLWLALDDACGAGPAGAPAGPELDARLQATLQHWRDWDALSSYDGPYDDMVRRSARVLKLLTFAPTGGIVAAPTTSLPERLGGERNWDYRFCWLRDASLVLHALLSLGYAFAADRFFAWLVRAWHPDHLQIMYRLDGGTDLPEFPLPELEGYAGSRPVRVGNDAASQVQLDVFGHVLDAAHEYLLRRGATTDEPLQRVLAHMADMAAARWREPDQGLWEMRSPPAQHLSSKLLCWVALDRALRLADAGHLQGDTVHWAAEREAIRRLLLDKGFNRRVGAFTQCIGDDALDASALLIPIVGFLPASDARVLSTVRCIREQLMEGGLVYRYRRPDGMSGHEGTFAICSFWLVDNLALQGRVDEARGLFEHIVSFASELGLMAEEIEPDNGRLLGNYPQGYTHLALIRSALTIERVERGQAATPVESTEPTPLHLGKTYGKV